MASQEAFLHCSCPGKTSFSLPTLHCYSQKFVSLLHDLLFHYLGKVAKVVTTILAEGSKDVDSCSGSSTDSIVPPRHSLLTCKTEVFSLAKELHKDFTGLMKVKWERVYTHASSSIKGFWRHLRSPHHMI